MPVLVQSFVDGEIENVVLRSLRVFNDTRGWLVELFRQDELEQDRWPAMTYVSQTLPGVTRGPHEHVDQTDGFAFIGPSDFKLFLWDTHQTARRKAGEKSSWLARPTPPRFGYHPA